MKRKSTATAALDSQLGRAMRKVLEQMEKSEERGEKSEDREAEDYRRGGKVRGLGTATSDSILARISNGEYILPKPAVDMVGANNLEAIRQAALARTPGYALGGLAFGGSGLNFQTPGEATSTTFFPSTTVNPMTTGTAIGGGMRQSPAQPTGSVNQYGNDMSLTNRMNAGTDQLRAMRAGPATAAPTQQQPDFMTGLKSLLNPQQQAQDAYKAARGRADALDVASGRFDREYAPGFKYGGMVSQKQWERLPRFAPGGLSNFLLGTTEDKPADILEVPPQVKEIQAARERASQQPVDMGTTLFGKGYDPSVYAGSVPPVPPGFKDIGNAVKSGWEYLENTGKTTYPVRQPMEERWSALTGTPPPPGRSQAFQQKAFKPPPMTGALPSPEPWQSKLPDVGGSPEPWQSRLPDISGLTNRSPQGQEPAPLPTTPGPGAGGYEKLPGTDIYRREASGTTTYTGAGLSAMGGGPGQATFQGTRQPGTYKLRDGNLVRLGDNPAGGSLGIVGTPETKGMTQAEATAYNVANLNRQYEALKSRNEAYGLGGSNVGSALPAAPAPVDIWARPGDSFGDSQMRQAQYESLLKDAGSQRGVGAKRRAAAMIDAAQALVAPGVAVAKMNADQAQAMTQGLMGMKTAELQTQASERQKAIASQQAQQAAEQAQKNWQYERDQADRQKAQDLAVRVYGQQARNQTRPAVLSEKDISEIMNRYSTPAVPGQPATVALDKLHGDYNVAPLPTDRSQMQAGQIYYDPSDPASPYKIATPQGIRKLGGRRDLIIYGHTTNPAARGTPPAGRADEEG